MPTQSGLELEALAQAHELAGHTSPVSDRVVEQTWSGIRRLLGAATEQEGTEQEGTAERSRAPEHGA